MHASVEAIVFVVVTLTVFGDYVSSVSVMK
jgi:hypothetical protein